MSRKMKKIVGVVLTLIMAMSVVPAIPVKAAAEYEVVQGGAGKQYKLPSTVGQSVTLTVACTSTDDNMLFWAEIADQSKSHWITTVSNANSSWYFTNDGAGAISSEIIHGAENCAPGDIYTVKVTYSAAGTYTLEYANYTKGYICIKYTAPAHAIIANDAYVHINARSGKYYVYEGTPEANGFSASRNTVAVNVTHGTDRTKYYTEADVNNTIPDGYAVNDATQGKAKDGKYSDYFLKSDLQTVKIDVDESNLNYLLQNASLKPYVLTKAVTIGDQKVAYAGLKTKGNNTLATTSESTTSDRFSFTVNFGKYVKKSKGYTATQNFFGCKKISFNCMRSDKTLMREYNAMRLMDKMGVPTPEYGVAKLYINNQYYGVYFMVESIDNTILEREYEKGSSNFTSYLTKPSYIAPYMIDELLPYRQNGEFTLESMENILYKDGEGVWHAEYPLTNIGGMWENDADKLQDVAEMMPTLLNWEYKLTNLHNGKDFDGKTIDVQSAKYVELVSDLFGDLEETLRYFASHSYIVQMDNMFTWRQNYGLYMSADQKATLLPWDYDLGWGALGDPNTQETIANWNIDRMYNDVNPWNGGRTPSSFAPADYYKSFKGGDGVNVGTPLFNVIFQNNTLREKYHKYMGDCAKVTTLGGTTTRGKHYSAGAFNDRNINVLYDKVVAAATEKLASNVYYLDNIAQPDSVTTRLPKLNRLIAERAVGVWLQVNNQEGKVVDGDTNSGKLVAVDAATGIFTRANYTASDVVPKLTVTEEQATSTDYKAVKSKLQDQLTDDSVLKVYTLADTKKPSGSYTVFLPAPESKAKVYTYKSGTLTPLTTTSYNSGELVSVSVNDLSAKIVLAQEKAAFVASIVKDENVLSVDAYNTADFTKTADIVGATTIKARDSKTGEYDLNGDGQINFIVKVKDGYEIASVVATPTTAFKNLKDEEETGVANAYRITKVTGNITVTIKTKKIGGTNQEETKPGEKEETKEPEATKPGENQKPGGTTGTTTGSTGSTGSTGVSGTSGSTSTANLKLKAPTSLKVKAAKKKATVKFKKVTGATGYQIRYSTKSNMKGAKKKTSAKNSKVIKGLKSKKKYYFQVRAYKIVSGAKKYGSWSAKKKVKIK